MEADSHTFIKCLFQLDEANLHMGNGGNGLFNHFHPFGCFQK